MQQVDVYKLIEGKSPKLARRIPGFIIRYLKRTVHQDEVNEILSLYGDLEGVEFARATLRHMGIEYHSEGMEKLDPAGRYVFASNHPFGGMDGMMLADEVGKYFGDVRVVVNDLLMHLDPLKSIFIPVNKHGRQNDSSVRAFNDAFESDIPIITFPAGLCSRRTKGVVCDTEWKSNFIRKAVQSERDIVPVYFEGTLSNFFYRLDNFRKKVGIKANIAMLYLPDEMFRQKGGNFTIRIGDPVPWQSLLDGRSAGQAAEYMKTPSYGMKPPPMKR